MGKHFVSFQLTAELATYLGELDTFIEAEIKPVKAAGDKYERVNRSLFS